MYGQALAQFAKMVFENSSRSTAESAALLVCECCSSLESLIELSRVNHTHFGVEVYREMLLECFAITIPSYPHGGKICTACVKQLRAARDFRRLVLHTQEMLQKKQAMLSQKVQFVERSAESDQGCEGESSDENKPDIKRPKTIGERRLQKLRVLDTRKLRKLCGRRVKDTLRIKAQSTLKEATNTKKLIKKSAALSNAGEILSKSNVTPFRGYFKSGYRCYYCNDAFEDPAELRTHTSMVHSAKKSAGSVTLDSKNHFELNNFVVYVDVKDLTCEKCGARLESITDLRTHLTAEHAAVLFPETIERYIPFVLAKESYECHCCKEKFVSFRSLVFHMNGHFENFKCNSCGEGFITIRRLKNHIQQHNDLSLMCAYCSKSFPSKIKLHMHQSAVHGSTNRFQCPHCDEKFYNYNKRERHLIDTHGKVSEVHECKWCDKKYHNLGNLNVHVRKVHLGEKKLICLDCGYRCFSGNELKRHAASHSEVEMYTCKFCSKPYMRLASLKDHIKAAHKELVSV